jgi:ketosteroid isomerase-like protein
MKQCLALCLVVLAGGVLISAQDAEQAAKKKQKATSGDLYETIAGLDAQVFGAFNAGDVDRLMGWFTADVEFYDDGGGNALSDFAATKKDFVTLLHNVPDLRRQLVPGTLEVYPLKGYGAIEVGEHRFCHEENGKQDCAVTKFSMVWRKTGETWKLARVLSYAH